MTDDSLTGRVVYCKTGRDKDRVFIITDIINKDYVYISDGDTRKIEKPKKKKLKHITLTDITASDLKEALLSNKVSNNKIKSLLKSFIQSKDNNEEV